MNFILPIYIWPIFRLLTHTGSPTEAKGEERERVQRHEWRGAKRGWGAMFLVVGRTSNEASLCSVIFP